ncbi:MAG TPA: putative glycoside hydrolase [Patescibacteria group bacterium]|nr:putative glycoside hydrolase [Patescibacteria group bacterium]
MDNFSPKIKTPILLSIFIFLLLSAFILINVPHGSNLAIDKAEPAEAFSEAAAEAEEPEVVKHLPTPEFVKGLYLTASSFASAKYRAALLESLPNGRINALVIDIKDSSGHVLYQSQLSELKETGAIRPVMKDLPELIRKFHELGIYLIARQVVFQDALLAQARPELAFKNKSGGLWRNYQGLYWLDPSKTEVWDYNLAIAREAAALGFDEINFDYIRYPSDGSLSSLDYNLPAGKTKAEVLKDFFSYLTSDLRQAEIKSSVDLFGLAVDYAGGDYDLGIGQRFTDAWENFDYVCPMMYASHYADNYLGIPNPAEYPGRVLSYGLKRIEPYLAAEPDKFRPWLQAFSLGAAYGPARINEQASVIENATTTAGWLFWNARNYYPDYIFDKIIE